MRLRLLVVAVLLCPMGVELNAQEGTGRVAGQVVDRATGRPVVSARITIVGTGQAVETDVDGRFRTPPLPAGLVSLRAAAIGYSVVTADSVQVRAGAVTAYNLALAPQAVQVEEIVVGAERPARASSAEGLLAIQQTAPVVLDGISAEQIARSPDSDASEAVARVTGVSIVDNKYVVVRGLSERYSNTLLNGVELPSPDPTRKVVPLDIFPASLLEAIVTAKTATPDRPGDFAGGSVDLQTRDFPDQRVLSLSLQQGFNSLSTFEDFGVPARRGRARLGFADDSRQLPGPLPPFGNADPEARDRFFQSMRNVWTPAPGTALPELGASATYGDQSEGGTLGWVLSASYSSRNELQPSRLFQFIASIDDPQPQLGARSREARGIVDWGLVGNVAARLGSGTKLGWRNLYTRYAEDGIITSDGFNVDRGAGALRFYQARYFSRSLLQTQLTGDHVFRLLASGTRLEWKATLARAAEDEPDNRSVRYARGENEQVYVVERGSQANWWARFLRDRVRSGQVDLALPIQLRAPGDGQVKVGALVRDRRRDFDANLFQALPAQIPPGGQEVLALPPEQLFAPENIGSNMIIERRRALAQSYAADDRITAFYGMLDADLLPGLRVAGGLRMERWDLDLQLRDPLDPAAAPITREKTDALWSANLTWLAAERVNVRLGGFRSVSRPDPREVAPDEFAPIATECAYRGNAALTRSSIYNADVRLEFYPSPGELLSASGFYKHFDLPVVELVDAETGRCFVQPVNAERARTYGLEVEFRKGLGFLDGALSRLSVTGNVTLSSSEATVSPAFSAAGILPRLTGQSDLLANAGLAYAGPEGRTSVSVLVNYFGDRVVRYGGFEAAETGILKVPDVVEQGRVTLDAKLQQRFGALTVSLSGQNLTNARVRYTQTLTNAEALATAYDLGVRVALGLSHAL